MYILTSVARRNRERHENGAENEKTDERNSAHDAAQFNNCSRKELFFLLLYQKRSSFIDPMTMTIARENGDCSYLANKGRKRQFRGGPIADAKN